jgi:hypothetical protein
VLGQPHGTWINSSRMQSGVGQIAGVGRGQEGREVVLVMVGQDNSFFEAEAVEIRRLVTLVGERYRGRRRMRTLGRCRSLTAGQGAPWRERVWQDGQLQRR